MASTVSADERYRGVFDRYHTEVYVYCRRRTDAKTAADCLAETFLVAWRRIDDIPDGDAALGWLYGVARRVLANEFRHHRRSRRLLTRIGRNDPVSETTPEVVALRREQDRLILAALSALRPVDQEVLRLAWWEELAHTEIADLLGCSVNAVAQRVHRAARRVAKEYNRLDHSHIPVEATQQQLPGGDKT